MAIDLAAIKNRLAEMENATSRTNYIWKPEPGEHLLRIVPCKFQPQYPFIELYFHYNLGKRTILSPHSFNRYDPIYEFSQKLKESGDKSDWQMSKKFEPKLRIYVPVIIRGKETAGVKFWGIGKQVYADILQYINDPDYGDITDINTGRDLTITVTPPPPGGKSFAETKVRVKPNSTPVGDASIIAIIKNQPSSIQELFPEKTPDELNEILTNFLSGDNGETGQETGQDGTVNSTSNSAEQAPVSETSSSDTKQEVKTKAVDQFEELFMK